ncbi:hypothetical protein [Pseudomonas sp.]|uniref:PKD domain-containing protein n=1 Tax=Pseudomonas sp. TaxID=306 RepID=UPI0025F7F3CB|nr:hypothetical protein [Pseudomonas sp.]
MVDATCVDPDYNKTTLVIDSKKNLMLSLPDGSSIPYTEVKGHFPATKAAAQLPAGVNASPTTANHSVTWLFPEKSYWQHRFFQQSYPLPIDFLNIVDTRFAFTNGGYTVSTMPGNYVTGYRVSAAAAKLAKEYANELYSNRERIYGYIYGQSGGSVQMMGANEGTSGVWDGIVPVVIATDGLNTHSFQWAGLYALRVPDAKRKAIAQASAPGSGQDIYAGLTADERAALNELLNAGFAQKALENWTFSVGSALPLSGALAAFDPTYEDDFWSKPGYEGADPPAYLAAAKVDGFAKVTDIQRSGGIVTSLSFDPATVPSLGSIGSEGLQFYVYAADGKTRIASGKANALNGKLEGSTLTLTPGNDPTIVAALKTGARIRINNRFVLAACFYPRHSILDNGSRAYNQYKNADGSPRYVQRSFQAAHIANIGAAGGRRETGNIKVRTIVLENLSDPASYPYVAGLYADQVRRALGAQTESMFRIYYQDNAPHGAFPTAMPDPSGGMAITRVASVGGVLNQALLDLAAWAERGADPLPSTNYALDAMTQVVLPRTAKERGGLQPVVELTANGSERVQVAVNRPVTLVAKIDMPPGAGEVVDYDWYLGAPDSKFEPAIALSKPQRSVSISRKVKFPAPGDYAVTFRVRGERNGKSAAESTTPLENIARVRVIVR